MIDKLPEKVIHELNGAEYMLFNKLNEVIEEVNILHDLYSMHTKWHFVNDTPKPTGQMIGGVPQVEYPPEIIIKCTHKHPDGRDAWVNKITLKPCRHGSNSPIKKKVCEICGEERC
jgi:hypothetical protein